MGGKIRNRRWYDDPVKRALPALLFGAITLAVFWRFLVFGESIYAVNTVRAQLALPAAAPRAPGDYPAPSSDNILPSGTVRPAYARRNVQRAPRSRMTTRAQGR